MRNDSRRKRAQPTLHSEESGCAYAPKWKGTCRSSPGAQFSRFLRWAPGTNLKQQNSRSFRDKKKMRQVGLRLKSSLQRAKLVHQPWREVAKLRSRGSAAQLLRDIRIMARAAPPGDKDFAFEGHYQASSKLWTREPLPSNFDYGADQPAVAVAC